MRRPRRARPVLAPAQKVDYVKALGASLKGLRVAWSDTLGYAKVVDPEVRASCERAARRFRDFGCKVETVDPKWPSPMSSWFAIFGGGIATRMAPYLAERRADIDPGLAKIIEEAAAWPPSKYVQAWFDRLAWNDHPRRLFEKYDLLLTPTIAGPPFRVGLDNATEIAGQAIEPYDWIPFTPPFN